MIRTLGLLTLALCLISAPAEAARPSKNSGATTSISCLKPELRALVVEIASRFGPIKVISTCRPGAVIRGSGKPSLHRYGRAADIVISNKASAVRWLRSQGKYGVITYKKLRHVHIDIGRGAYYARM